LALAWPLLGCLSKGLKLVPISKQTSANGVLATVGSFFVLGKCSSFRFSAHLCKRCFQSLNIFPTKLQSSSVLFLFYWWVFFVCLFGFFWGVCVFFSFIFIMLFCLYDDFLNFRAVPPMCRHSKIFKH